MLSVTHTRYRALFDLWSLVYHAPTAKSGSAYYYKLCRDPSRIPCGANFSGQTPTLDSGVEGPFFGEPTLTQVPVRVYTAPSPNVQNLSKGYVSTVSVDGALLK